MAVSTDSPTLGRGTDWNSFYATEPLEANDPFSPSSFGMLLFAAPDAASALNLLGAAPSNLTFADIGGTIGLDQLPPGSLVTVDSIGEDGLYFFNDATSTPSLLSSSEVVNFISPNLSFSDIIGSISIDQLPAGTVATIDSIDADALYFFDNNLFLPKLINQADALTFLGITGGGSTFLANNTARVDPSGNDSTGTIGDLGKPFNTVQAAIAAFEAGSYTNPVIDIGNNVYSENLTTSLPKLDFKATDGNRCRAFSSLAFTAPTGEVDLGLYSCSAGNVSAATTGLFNCVLENVEGSNFSNSAGEISVAADVGTSFVSNVTAGGAIVLSNLASVGTVSAPGFNIGLGYCLTHYLDNTNGDYIAAPVIDSAGSEVFATFSLIQEVTDCGTLHLKDSRVIGTNNASSTVYADVLLPNTRAHNTARVDPSGSDATGTIGDLGKPFLTVQAALTACEAAMIDTVTIIIGSNYFSEDLTTSLQVIGFVGNGVVDYKAFNSINLTGNGVGLSLYGCYGGNVTAASNAGLSLNNGEVDAITNTAGGVNIQSDLEYSYVGNITAAGNVLVRGVVVCGAISAPGFNIILRDCIPRYGYGADQAPAINSAGSEVWAYGSVISEVTIAGTLHLIDSRVVGTNNASSTVYADVLLNGQPGSIDFAQRKAYYAGGAKSLDWGNGLLYATDGTTLEIQYDEPGHINFLNTFDFFSQPTGGTGGALFQEAVLTLNNGTGFDVYHDAGDTPTDYFKIFGPTLYSNTSNKSLDAVSRKLYAPDGTTVIFDYSTSVSGARTSLGLAIGTNVQAWDTQLDSLAGLSYTGNSLKVVRVNVGETAFELATISGGGTVATDAIWDAKGDLAVGTGSDTAAKLTVGANDTILMADSAQTTGQKWGTPSTVRTALGLVIGTNVQAFDTDLTTWAGITPGTGIGTFLATPSSANLASAITDETGTGALVFANTPTLVTPNIGAATGTSASLTSSFTTTQSIGAVSTDGLLLANTTAAAAGAQQWSPSVHWKAAGWKTTATAASQVLDFVAEIQPVQETTAPQNRLVFSAQANATGYKPVFNVVVDAVNVPGVGDQTWIWQSSGGSRGVWVGASGILCAGANPGTGLTPATDGGTIVKSLGVATRNAGLYTWTSGTDPGAGFDTGLARNSAGVVEVNNGTAGTFRDLKLRQHFIDQTITAGGTTGAQTINKAAGTVNFAAAATSLVVTNSLVSTSSSIYCVIRTNDTTAIIKNVVPASGSFTINLNAAATAETSVGFLVIN